MARLRTDAAIIEMPILRLVLRRILQRLRDSHDKFVSAGGWKNWRNLHRSQLGMPC